MGDTPPIGSTTAAPPPPPPTTTWNVRLGYRLTGGSQFSHGVQLLGGPNFRLNDHFRLGLSIEFNNMFLTSDNPPKDLSRDAVVGSHFDGLRGSRFDGTTYTDVTGGTAYANRSYFMELIPETQLTYRPVRTFPFEITFRLAAGMAYTTLHTRTEVRGGLNPGEHTGPGGCIPGDILCPGGTIPEPMAGPSSHSFESDAGSWAFWVRFGPRIAFPIHDSFSIGTELLFQTNSTTGTFDPVWRTNIRLIVPLGDTFQLIADPRYVLRSTPDKGIQHGFDLFVGFGARL